MVTDIEIQDWAKQAGVYIATNFDREMFRKFAEVVIKNTKPGEVPVTRQKKSDETK